jgi:hypothetical protein
VFPLATTIAAAASASASVEYQAIDIAERPSQAIGIGAPSIGFVCGFVNLDIFFLSDLVGRVCLNILQSADRPALERAVGSAISAFRKLEVSFFQQFQIHCSFDIVSLSQQFHEELFVIYSKLLFEFFEDLKNRFLCNR